MVFSLTGSLLVAWFTHKASCSDDLHIKPLFPVHHADLDIACREMLERMIQKFGLFYMDRAILLLNVFSILGS